MAKRVTNAQLMEAIISIADRVEKVEDYVFIGPDAVTPPVENRPGKAKTPALKAEFETLRSSGPALPAAKFADVYKAQFANGKRMATDKGTVGLWYVKSESRNRDYVLPKYWAKVSSMKNGVLLGKISPDGSFKPELKGLPAAS